jgi:hypothetical protein
MPVRNSVYDGGAAANAGDTGACGGGWEGGCGDGDAAIVVLGIERAGVGGRVLATC